MLSFQQALNALIPSMKLARILDSDLIGYDDWSRICDTLYTLLVVEPIRSSLESSRQADFDLPCYGTEYESYEHFSLIRGSGRGEINSMAVPTGTPLLHRFIPSEKSGKQFNLVETIRIDESFHLLEDSYETHNQPYFTCIVPEGKQWQVLDEITVRLD